MPEASRPESAPEHSPRRPPRRRKRSRFAGEPYPPPFRREFLAPRYWLTWLALALLWWLQRLPAVVRAGLARAFGSLIWRTHAKRRAIVELNLAWCFPERSAAARTAMARAYFRGLAHAALDLGLLWWGSPEQLRRRTRLYGLERLEAARAAGRNIILLTPHMVALEYGAQAIALRLPAVGIVKPARNRLFDYFLARGRTRFHGRIYRRDQGIRPLVNACRDGELIYYLPDEDLGRTQDVVFAPFFGVPAATLTAMSRLARVCKAEVFPFVTVYDPDSDIYHARVLPPLEAYPSGEMLQDAVHLNRVLEDLIREQPEQYMWSLRIFNTRPEGGPSPYPRPPARGNRHRV